MCEIELKTGGYKLKNGKVIHPDNIDELDKDEIQELLNTNISAWEFLMLRNSNHHLVDSINKLTGKMQMDIQEGAEEHKTIMNILTKIEKNMYITLDNNGGVEKSLGEAINSLWLIHVPELKKKKRSEAIAQALAQYKYPTIIIGGVIFGLSVQYHAVINLMLTFAKDTITIFAGSAILLSALGYVIKKYFDKKDK